MKWVRMVVTKVNGNSHQSKWLSDILNLLNNYYGYREKVTISETTPTIEFEGYTFKATKHSKLKIEKLKN